MLAIETTDARSEFHGGPALEVLSADDATVVELSLCRDCAGIRAPRGVRAPVAARVAVHEDED